VTAWRARLAPPGGAGFDPAGLVARHASHVSDAGVWRFLVLPPAGRLGVAFTQEATMQDAKIQVRLTMFDGSGEQQGVSEFVLQGPMSRLGYRHNVCVMEGANQFLLDHHEESPRERCPVFSTKGAWIALLLETIAAEYKDRAHLAMDDWFADLLHALVWREMEWDDQEVDTIGMIADAVKKLHEAVQGDLGDAKEFAARMEAKKAE
jgi:hypothetical protein